MSQPEQQRAFLESIRETPDDDTPRLIYADWLDDHDEPDRAEFIRVQCELARLPSKDERRPVLEERERDLLVANRAVWLGPLARALSPRRCIFHRGFPEWLTLRPKVMADQADELDGRVPAGRVTLTGTLDTPALGAVLASPRMGWVRGLSYENPQVAESGLELLAESAGLPRLAELSISFATFTTAGVRALATSPHRSGLRRLWLDSFHDFGSACPDSAAVLAAPDVAFRLHALALIGQRLDADGAAALAGARHLAELRELDLRLNEIRNNGAIALARSPHLGRLSLLNLHGNRLTTRAVRALAASPLLDGVRLLFLGANALGDTGAAVLAGCPRLAELTWLELTMAGVTDRGAEALASSPHLSRVTGLDLFGNDLTDRGSQALFESPPLRQLEQISLGGRGTGLSSAQRQQWIARLGKGAKV